MGNWNHGKVNKGADAGTKCNNSLLAVSYATVQPSFQAHIDNL